MKSMVRIPLHADARQFQRLLELQQAFARACNALAPVVKETRTWNRVALHNLAYRKLREAFPDIGSQMACNAIYSVSRAARLVFQSTGSPFHHTLLAGKPLPLLQFLDTAPVYFDRHTLSLKQGQASMYTLDGRMKFQLALQAEQEAAFHRRKLLEAALIRRGDQFELQFSFGVDVAATPVKRDAGRVASAGPFPVPVSLSQSTSPEPEPGLVPGLEPLPIPNGALLPPYLNVEVPA
jgi:hypothetical protein